MHDPLTMVFQIRAPRLRPRKDAWNRRSRWTWAVATVWHRDPSGYDSTTCRILDHWKHVPHWRLQMGLWQTFRRRWVDRCAWCGTGSAKGDPVNISHQWDAPKRPWWRHTDCFHRDCSAIERAHRNCTCSVPTMWHYRAYGDCLECGKYRPWHRTPVSFETNQILASIPTGQRDPAKYAQAQQLWAEHNATTKETQ